MKTPTPITSSSTADTTITQIPASQIDTTFSTCTNLTSSALAASIVSSSDEWFAEAKNLLTPTPPVRKPGVFVFSGAWYDGWETRRHNPDPFDWVVISLGCVGQIAGVEIDTAYFNGNEAPAVALDGYYHDQQTWSDSEFDTAENVSAPTFTHWSEILPVRSCGPNQRQAWKLDDAAIRRQTFTHLRLKMYPDGGIARLRVYGHVSPPPLPSPSSASTDTEASHLEDLAATLNGGLPLSSSNSHFGRHENLTLPGRGLDMGDGWETARSRTPNHEDWALVRLGLPGRSIERIVVDTKDFRGNFPRAVRVEGYTRSSTSMSDSNSNSRLVESAITSTEKEKETDPRADDPNWITLVADSPCQADTEHVFQLDSAAVPGQGKAWTHVKMSIIPDGGVKRLRVWGRRTHGVY